MSADAGALPPTSAELKALVDAAAAGSKAAQEKLDAVLKEHGELRGRVDKLEAAAAQKPAFKPVPQKPPPSREEAARELDGCDPFGLLED